MKKISFTLLALAALFTAAAQHRSTFDDLFLPSNTYYNGSDLSGGFLSGDAYFLNEYDSTYYSWSGFGYSNIKINPDTITTAANDISYQYSCAAGSGVQGSANYGISYAAYGGATIRLEGFAPGHEVYGMYVTNNTYTYLSMKYGDTYAKKFGGATGMDSDWYRLTISGWYQGNVVANSVDFYLADFRSPDSTQHYILKTWKFVDLTSLGNVDSLFFSLNSTDTAGGFGMNTPGYLAIDNFITTDGATISTSIAVNDSFSFVYEDTITGNADTLHANILANDSLSSFLGYTVTLISSPEILGASAYLDSNNNLTYIPAPGIQGVDTLQYTICNEAGTCDTAQILVFVKGPLNTGIQNIAATDLYMYPNPASSSVSIHYTSAIQTVSVIDMSGREVMAKSVNKNAASINVASLSPGVYSVIIHTADGVSARRLVKE